MNGDDLRTAFVHFRLKQADFDTLKLAADRSHKTVSDYCREAAFAALVSPSGPQSDAPSSAHHAEVMAEFATIRDQLQTLIAALPTPPPNPYAGLELAEAVRALERQSYLEANEKTIPFKELNELCELRESLIGSLWPVWISRGVPAIREHLGTGEVPPLRRPSLPKSS